MGFIKQYKKQKVDSKGEQVTSYTAVARFKGHTSSQTFTNRKDAERWWRREEGALRDRYSNGSLLPSHGRRSVLEALERYEREDFQKLDPKGWLCYLAHCKRLFGALSLNELRFALIEEAMRVFQNERVDDPRKNSSVNKIRTIMSNVCKCAIRWEWISTNPCQHVQKLSERADERHRFLSDEERVRLLEAAERSSYPALSILIQVAILTGYRQSIVTGLKWSQIDFERNAISVAPTKEERGKRGKPRAKNHPLTASLRRLLVHHGGLLKASGVQSPFVFPSKTDASKPWSDWRTFRAAVKAAGLEGEVTFHTLRHTHGSYLGLHGVPMKVIAGSLGHTSLQSTNRYVHTPDAQVADEIERVLGDIDLSALNALKKEGTK